MVPQTLSHEAATGKQEVAVHRAGAIQSVSLNLAVQTPASTNESKPANKCNAVSQTEWTSVGGRVSAWPRWEVVSTVASGLTFPLCVGLI